MPQPVNDPFSISVLVAVVVALLGFIARMYEKRLADKDDHYHQRLDDKDKEIENRDRQIAELRQENKDMAARSQSLVSSADKMLDYFLDGNASPRSEEPTPARGRRTQ
jgi:hypothetical protein